MKRSPSLLFALAAAAGCSLLCQCDQSSSPRTRSASKGPQENIDEEEKRDAKNLRAVDDPIKREIAKLHTTARTALIQGKFSDLEGIARDLRERKAVFDNGSWQIYQFYTGLECEDNSPAQLWKEHFQLHQRWVTEQPESITAQVAMADFLVNYAWEARGNGFANEISAAGRELFVERLAAAHKVLEEASKLKERDPYWWLVASKVALGQGWHPDEFSALINQGLEFAPKFWALDVKRAYSLMPRWYGQKGDWEKYALETSERPDGLGAEVYTRIVIDQLTFYDNIFRDTKASWPKVRQGLELMRQRYPKSPEPINYTALLATAAMDRELAKQMFTEMGDNYVPSIWKKPERLTHYRHWAFTGKW